MTTPLHATDTHANMVRAAAPVAEPLKFSPMVVSCSNRAGGHERRRHSCFCIATPDELTIDFLMGWAARYALILPRRVVFREFSSMFSGAGTAELAALSINAAISPDSAFSNRQAWDHEPGLMALLRSMPSIASLGCDLLSLWAPGGGVLR